MEQGPVDSRFAGISSLELQDVYCASDFREIVPIVVEK